jgi:acyl-CoA synthetase (AMP-forming)/AMP-acid ligase II
MDVDGGEKLIVVHEVGQRHLTAAECAEIKSRVREVIATQLDVALHDLALVKPGSVPRTTSGKIQRNACRQLYRRRILSLMEVQA